MGELLILCYHAVSEKFPASMSLSPSAFRDQLITLSPPRLPRRDVQRRTRETP